MESWAQIVGSERVVGIGLLGGGGVRVYKALNPLNPKPYRNLKPYINPRNPINPVNPYRNPKL